jgi:hypothetical protein
MMDKAKLRRDEAGRIRGLDWGTWRRPALHRGDRTAAFISSYFDLAANQRPEPQTSFTAMGAAISITVVTETVELFQLSCLFAFHNFFLVPDYAVKWSTALT